MTNPMIPQASRRRGCGCGCLVTTPLALLLTGLAIWLWLPQALRFLVFVVGGQEADPWPLAGATALIVVAQLIPRGLPALAARLRLIVSRQLRPRAVRWWHDAIARQRRGATLGGTAHHLAINEPGQLRWVNGDDDAEHVVGQGLPVGIADAIPLRCPMTEVDHPDGWWNMARDQLQREEPLGPIDDDPREIDGREVGDLGDDHQRQIHDAGDGRHDLDHDGMDGDERQRW